MTAPLVIEFTPEETEQLSRRAHAHGYDNPADYVRALIEDDVSDSTDVEDPAEDLRIAWRQAKRGDVLTEEEFWKAMSDDV